MTIKKCRFGVVVASFLAIATVAIAQPADKSVIKPNNKADPYPINCGQNPGGGAQIPGWVTGIGPLNAGPSRLLIKFVPKSDPSQSSFEISSIGPDSDSGRAIYTALLTAFTTNSQIVIFCNNSQEFYLAWVGKYFDGD